MSAEPPPTYNTSIFNQAYWGISTAGNLDDRYLQFPTGQGTETLPALVVTGQAKIQSSYLTSTTQNSSFSLKSSYGVVAGNNAFFGTNCGTLLIDGGSNTGMGNFDTLNTLTSGDGNCAFGIGALQNITTTNNNTGIGLNSGSSSTGDNNTFIGALTNTTVAGANNSTAVGYGATITASNQIVLGTVTESVIIPRNIRYTNSPMFARFLTGTQAIPNGAVTNVNFNNADPRNGSNTGITFSSGTFTNSNSYSITVTICACVLFVFNTVGEREALIEHSSQGRLVGFAIQASTVAQTQGTMSVTCVLNASESFTVQAYQTTGGSLNITNQSRCSVLVM